MTWGAVPGKPCSQPCWPWTSGERRWKLFLGEVGSRRCRVYQMRRLRAVALDSWAGLFPLILAPPWSGREARGRIGGRACDTLRLAIALVWCWMLESSAGASGRGIVWLDISSANPRRRDLMHPCGAMLAPGSPDKVCCGHRAPLERTPCFDASAPAVRAAGGAGVIEPPCDQAPPREPSMTLSPGDHPEAMVRPSPRLLLRAEGMGNIRCEVSTPSTPLGGCSEVAPKPPRLRRASGCAAHPTALSCDTAWR